jgi:thioredoxin-related protein
MKTIIAVWAVWTAVLTAGFGATGWTKDYDAALATAKRENKPVLVQFTGQKWCALCVILEKKIFSKKQFLETASKKWVLLELDLTRGKLDKMPPAQRAMYERNRKLAHKFKLRSVPTFILLDPNGKEFSRFLGESTWTVESFLKLLDDQLAKKGK